MFLDEKYFRTESAPQTLYGPLGERFRACDIIHIGMGLISTSDIFLGNLNFLSFPFLIFVMEVLRPSSWGCCEN